MEQPRDFSELESRLTDTARASFERAGVIAQNQGSPYVGTEHILLGILAQNSSLGAKILAESGVTLDRVETALELTPSAVVFAVVDHGVRADVWRQCAWRGSWRWNLDNRELVRSIWCIVS